MTLFNYTVTHDPGGISPVNITDFVQYIKWKDCGTGQVRTLTMGLQARDGQFITDATAGATPIIDEFQKIQISVTDEDSVTFTENYEVDKFRPVHGTQRGLILDVELLGPEHHLLRFPFTKQTRRRDQADSAFNVSRDIINIYNEGTTANAQPTISDHTLTGANTFPQFTANHYPFNFTQMPVYEGLRYIADRVGSSVAAGGGGDFWEFGFQRNPADENDLKFFARISGSIDSGVTITDANDVNPGEEEGGIESTLATVHATWGAEGLGTLPAQVGQFRDALTAWAALPDFLGGITYPEDSIVRRRGTGPDSQGDELHFKANKDTAIAPPLIEASNADWDSYNFTDFLTNEISISGQYSPFTNARDDAWKNCGANPDGSQNNDPPLVTSLYVWDMNQVVYDGVFFRTWVDVRATSPAGIPTQYLYGGVNPMRGFRVLVDGVGTGDFTGFDNDIVEFDSFNNEWRRFRATSDDEFVCVDDEAIVYRRTAGVWADDSNNNESNDPYHPVFAVFNSAGHNNKDNGAGGTFGDFSAVTYEFRYSQSDVTSLNSRTYYRAGACINLKAPFAPNSFNGETLGFIFGSNATVREPVTYDTNNLEFAPNGIRGYNHSQADELGPLDGIKFMTRFNWRYRKDGSGNLIRTGNIPCRAYMYDLLDNVVIADFTISHNDNWEEIFIPFSSFNEYRARIPWSIENLGSNAFLQELEILQRFDYTNIKKIGFLWMAPFDEAGRYTLVFNAFGTLFPNLEDFIVGLANDGFNIKWSIDAFHFTKPLLSVSPPITGASTRAMFVDFDEEPLIINRYQNDQANLAKLEQNQFRHQQFEVVTEGRFNINLFEQFTLFNSELVNASDAGPNTINLVAKEIEYTIDKPAAGIGGFMRKITGVKRLT